MLPSIYAHIVSYNSGTEILRCVESLRCQKDFKLGSNLIITIRDNASRVETQNILKSIGDPISVISNQQNLGFCGAHNQGVFEFLKGGAQYFLVLNPDVALTPSCLAELVKAIDGQSRLGAATPLLLRAKDDLTPEHPLIIDAAGMYLTPSLRHFDRGSGQPYHSATMNPEYVFGGTGACLLLRRDFIEAMILEGPKHDRDSERVYPQLALDRETRAALFDEAFFAYREDADLAWRATVLGWACRFVPSAIAYHRRALREGSRENSSSAINLLGVKNRFLLQVNNYSWIRNPIGIFPGLIFRNLVVLLGVLVQERSSLPAIMQFFKLFRRALERRRILFRRRRST